MGLIIRSSQIHAAGCYTTVSLSAGTRIVEYTGRRLTADQADELYEGDDQTYLFGLDDGKHVIDGHGMAAFINHSCQPNCETDEFDGRVWILAARDIAAGEELTYDYNLYDGEEGAAPCFCGTRQCRGTMYSPEEIRRQQRERHIAARERRPKQKPPGKAA